MDIFVLQVYKTAPNALEYYHGFLFIMVIYFFITLFYLHNGDAKNALYCVYVLAVTFVMFYFSFESVKKGEGHLEVLDGKVRYEKSFYVDSTKHTVWRKVQ